MWMNGRSDMTATGFALPVLLGAGGAGSRFVQRVRDHEFANPEEREAWQFERVRSLIALAIDRSRHYRQQLAAASVQPADIHSIADLGQLPILEKADLAGSRSADLQTRRMRLQRTMRSAGTSGQPVTVGIAIPAWLRTLARRRYLFASHGITFGSREARCWGRQHADGDSLFDRLLRRRIFTFEASDPDSRSAELVELFRFAPAYLYGYPSVISEMVEHWQMHDIPRPAIKGVVLTAERVPPSLVQDISEVLRCSVIREYGCSECDIIAFDCPAGRYHVASDHVIVESVDEEGGVGDALVTDLDNTLTPLIRYRLGDRIRLATESCPCGRTSPVIATIEGRTGENRYLSLPDGRRRHSVLFAYLFEDLRDSGVSVRQFKVQQTSPASIRVFLDPGPSDLPDSFQKQLTDMIRQRVGAPLAVDLIIGPLHRTPGTKWNYFVALNATVSR